MEQRPLLSRALWCLLLQSGYAAEHGGCERRPDVRRARMEPRIEGHVPDMRAVESLYALLPSLRGLLGQIDDLLLQPPHEETLAAAPIAEEPYRERCLEVVR